MLSQLDSVSKSDYAKIKEQPNYPIPQVITEGKSSSMIQVKGIIENYKKLIQIWQDIEAEGTKNCRMDKQFLTERVQASEKEIDNIERYREQNRLKKSIIKCSRIRKCWNRNPFLIEVYKPLIMQITVSKHDINVLMIQLSRHYEQVILSDVSVNLEIKNEQGINIYQQNYEYEKSQDKDFMNYLYVNKLKLEKNKTYLFILHMKSQKQIPKIVLNQALNQYDQNFKVWKQLPKLNNIQIQQYTEQIWIENLIGEKIKPYKLQQEGLQLDPNLQMDSVFSHVIPDKQGVPQNPLHNRFIVFTQDSMHSICLFSGSVFFISLLCKTDCTFLGYDFPYGKVGKLESYSLMIGLHEDYNCHDYILSQQIKITKYNGNGDKFKKINFPPYKLKKDKIYTLSFTIEDQDSDLEVYQFRSMRSKQGRSHSIKQVWCEVLLNIILHQLSAYYQFIYLTSRTILIYRYQADDIYRFRYMFHILFVFSITLTVLNHIFSYSNFRFACIQLTQIILDKRQTMVQIATLFPISSIHSL